MFCIRVCPANEEGDTRERERGGGGQQCETNVTRNIVFFFFFIIVSHYSLHSRQWKRGISALDPILY